MKRFRLFIYIAVFIAFLGGCTIDDYVLSNGYALLYGVSRYNLSFPEGYSTNLTYCDDDAADLNALLKSQNYITECRVDENASLAKMKADIEYYSTLVGENDIFIFFYSGHGGRYKDFAYGSSASAESNETGQEIFGTDSDDEWIFPFGSLSVAINYSNYDEWNQTAIKDDDLKNLLAPIKSKKKIIIIDACNSGGFIGPAPGVDTTPVNFQGDMNESFWDIADRSFRLFMDYPKIGDSDVTSSDAFVLSASGEQEETYENGGNIKHGLLTYSILYAMTPVAGSNQYMGDANNDGYITIVELYNFVLRYLNHAWNYADSGENLRLLPHLSGSPIDILLFRTR